MKFSELLIVFRNRVRATLRFVYEHPLIFFLIIALISFWPLALMLHSLPHDELNVVLAWKRFSSECLREGMIPLWNPYQQLGYPVHADLQYPVWYPELLLISALGRYSMFTLNLLFIGYVAIAGWGVFKLARTLKIDYHYALLCGAVYMLSGIFVGYAQSLVSILGAVWFPWVIAFYIRFLSSPTSWRRILELGLVIFLMLTGGYQAVSFMLFYVSLGIFLVKIIRIIRQRDFPFIRSILLGHLLLFLVLIPLLAGMVYSLYEVFPYLERLGGLSLESTQLFPFTPRSAISFLLPLSTVSEPALFKTDISMSNSFIGSIMLMAAFLGIRKSWKKPLLVLLGIFGIVYLMASFGPATPVQKWLSLYVPFLDLFKYASFYKLFFILAAILFAGNYFSGTHFETDRKERSRFLYGLLILLLFYLAALICSLFRFSFSDFSYFRQNTDLIQKLKNAGIFENVFVQSLIQLGILGTAMFLWLKKAVPSRYLLTGLILLEMFIAVQLNSPFTVYSDIKPVHLLRTLQSYPEGYPIPDHTPVRNNADAQMRSGNLYLNISNYTKQASADAWSSFWFKNWQKLTVSYPDFFDSILYNPVVYLTDNLRPVSEMGREDFSRDRIYVEQTVWEGLSHINFSHSPADTVIISAFTPRQIRCKVNTLSDTWLVLLQNGYPGWEVFIDGEETAVETVNLTFMGIPVPAGTHDVVFRYDNPRVRVGFFLSMAGFVILVGFILVLNWKKLRAPKLTGILIIGYLLFAAFSIGYNRIMKLREKKDQAWVIGKWHTIRNREKTNTVLSLISTDNLSEFDPDRSGPCNLCVQTIRENQELPVIRDLERLDPDTIYYARLNTRNSQGIAAYLKSRFKHSHTEINTRNVSFMYFTGRHENMESPSLGSQSGFQDIGWEKHPVEDSLVYYSPPYSFFTDSGNVFPFYRKIDAKRIDTYRLPKISIKGRVRRSVAKDIFLVLEARKGDKIRYYQGRKIGGSEDHTDDWELFFCVFTFDVRLKADDTLALYVYSPNDVEFWLDDMHLSITE